MKNWNWAYHSKIVWSKSTAKVNPLQKKKHEAHLAIHPAPLKHIKNSIQTGSSHDQLQIKYRFL